MEDHGKRRFIPGQRKFCLDNVIGPGASFFNALWPATSAVQFGNIGTFQEFGYCESSDASCDEGETTSQSRATARRLAQRLLAGILCGAGARGAVQATGRQRSRLSIAVMGASSSSAALWKQSAARVRTLLLSAMPGCPMIVALSSGLAFTWVTSCRSAMTT